MIRTWSLAPNGETESAENLKRRLLASEPALAHPEISLEIISDLYLPERQIDLVLLYEDKRDSKSFLKTKDGSPLHSFVLIIEVKKHSPDNIRFQGESVFVKYGRGYSNATYQCDQQTYAFRRYQESLGRNNERLRSVFTQRAIWLARAPEASFLKMVSKSSVPVFFQQINWLTLVSGLKDVGGATPNEMPIRAFSSLRQYHSLETLLSRMTNVIKPTTLDLKRINFLTKARFDAEKTQYIKNLGEGLLILKGRGGTGKTISLLQIGLHLSRQGKKCLFLTYNHGLISDITRQMLLIRNQDPSLEHLPHIQTRYSFIKDMFVSCFGKRAEKDLIMSGFSIEQRENERLKRLLHVEELDTQFDFILVDEAQDWKTEQRDFLYKLFGVGRVIVADGVDQFVGIDRCKWDENLPQTSINKRHSLKASRRTKGATCQVVGEIAVEFGIKDWDLEPDPEIFGGRVSVMIEPSAKTAVERGLAIIEADIQDVKSVASCDNLICLPSSGMSGGVNYEVLFDRTVKEHGKDSWRGFDDDDRRQYVERHEQLRAIRYQSCRGMEGWTTLCLGLDKFFDFQRQNSFLDKQGLEDEMRERDGLLFSKSAFADELAKQCEIYAVNWLMIPLTRSIDHLVVHLVDEQSILARALKNISNRSPGAINWI